MLTYNQRYRPRTEREYTKRDLTVYDSAGNTALNALTVYGKSEVVDGKIVSAGEGWSVVKLADLTWTERRQAGDIFVFITHTPYETNSLNGLCNKYIVFNQSAASQMPNKSLMTFSRWWSETKFLIVRDDDYTTISDFVASLGDATLCYQLADPTQGNVIAVKTDNGTGINGTMATFTTGTPLRGIPDTDVRDVMQWDGSAGTVTKVCGEVDLGTLTWGYNSTIASNPFFYASDINIKLATSQSINENLVCAAYNTYSFNTVLYDVNIDKAIGVNSADNAYKLVVKNTDYTDATAFKTAMSGVMLIYELATPTTTPLTQTENESLASLRTFDGTAHFTNNATTDMTVNYTIKVPTIS